MAGTNNSFHGTWLDWYTKFKHDWKMIVRSILTVALNIILDGIHPLPQMPVVLFLVSSLVSIVADLLFEYAGEIMTKAPVNGESRSKHKRKAKSNRMSKPSQNFLARFAPEIRLQIFKHYFATSRPQRLYQESHYKLEWSLNLLKALKYCQDQQLYNEALDQYHKVSHFLFNGWNVNRTFLASLEPWALQSIKHITFGPSVIEGLMIRDRVTELSATRFNRRDAAEHAFVPYLIQTVLIFGRLAPLSKANNLETITIYLSNDGQLQLEWMMFYLICFRTFPKLRKITYCFPKTRPVTFMDQHSMYRTMEMMHHMWTAGRGREFDMIPWSRVTFGCQHDISGFRWITDDEERRKVEIGMTIYHIMHKEE